MPRFGCELTIHVHSTSASAEVPTAVPPTARPAANVGNTSRITAAGTRSGKPVVGLMPATRSEAASTACSSGNTYPAWGLPLASSLTESSDRCGTARILRTRARWNTASPASDSCHCTEISAATGAAIRSTNRSGARRPCGRGSLTASSTIVWTATTASTMSKLSPTAKPSASAGVQAAMPATGTAPSMPTVSRRCDRPTEQASAQPGSTSVVATASTSAGCEGSRAPPARVTAAAITTTSTARTTAAMSLGSTAQLYRDQRPGLRGASMCRCYHRTTLRRHRKLLILAAALVLLLCGGAAAAYLIASRPVADVHNGLSEPFTSAAEPTSSAPDPTTGASKQPDYGAPWPMYGRNAAHNRDASDMTEVKPPYTRVWKKPGHGVLEYPPSYVDGVLYLAADSGWVGAYQAHSGELIWSKRFTKVLNQPAYYRGRVYFGSYDRNVYALDAATGKVVWKRKIGEQMESPPTLAAGRLYMGGLDGSVRALDSGTGRVLWTYHTSGAVKGAIAVSGGRLFFGDYAGVMYSLRAGNGGLIWRTDSNGLSSGLRSGSFYSTADVRYGRVYIGNTDGKLYSFVASNGRIAWTHTIDGRVYGSPAVWNGLVFDTGYDGNFEAMNARTGAVRWSTRLPYITTSSPTVIGRYVYVASHGASGKSGNLWAFDPRTGRKVWHFPDGWYSTVATAGPKQLVVTGPRHLYLLHSR